MNFITVNDITLHVKRSGEDDDVPMVFVNSLGCDLRIWDEVVPHLDDYRIIRYDKRGHGLSDCTPAPYRLRDHTDDLLALLNYLNVQSAVIVGISIGGMVAMDFAITYPDRVRALIVSDALPKIGTAEMWNERINNLHMRGMDAMGDAILARWFAPDFKTKYPSAYAGYLNMLTRMPLQGYMGSCAALRDADLTEACRGILAPTLLICGEEDPATSPELMRDMLEIIPNARYEIIAGAGHLPCIDQPQATASAIKTFLQDVFDAR